MPQTEFMTPQAEVQLLQPMARRLDDGKTFQLTLEISLKALSTADLSYLPHHSTARTPFLLTERMIFFH